MKSLIQVSAVACLLVSGLAFAGGKGCKWSDPEKAKAHITTHITFPTTGKEVKSACKAEMPDEFPKSERACFEAAIKDDAKFANADELKALVGLK